MRLKIKLENNISVKTSLRIVFGVIYHLYIEKEPSRSFLKFWTSEIYRKSDTMKLIPVETEGSRANSRAAAGISMSGWLCVYNRNKLGEWKKAYLYFACI